MKKQIDYTDEDIRIDNIIEDCVVIRIKDVPKHMAGIDLTWLDKEIRSIKDKLRMRIIR